MPPISPQQQAQQEKAKQLVALSHIFGWGGVGVLFILAPALGVATGSGGVGVAMAALGALGAIAGAVIGQVGRAMQGRVI